MTGTKVTRHERFTHVPQERGEESPSISDHAMGERRRARGGGELAGGGGGGSSIQGCRTPSFALSYAVRIPTLQVNPPAKEKKPARLPLLERSSGTDSTTTTPFQSPLALPAKSPGAPTSPSLGLQKGALCAQAAHPSPAWSSLPTPHSKSAGLSLAPSPKAPDHHHHHHHPIPALRQRSGLPAPS